MSPVTQTGTVVRVDSAAAAAWDAYVDRHPAGTLFHRMAWRRVVERCFSFRPWYLAFLSNGTWRGVLPLFEVGGGNLISVPFAVYGGILADDEAARDALLAAARTRLVARRGGYLELRFRDPSGLDHLPGTDLYVTYVRDLPPEPAACLGLLPRKARAAARHGRHRYGLEAVVSLDLLEHFPRLFLLNKRKLGSPTFSPRFFTTVVEEHREHVGLLTVLHEGRPVSAVLYFVYRDTIFPYFSGAVPGCERLHAANFMYLALMEEASRQGLRCFDFGRSRRGTGAARFKEHQGFRPTPLDYRYVLHRARAVPQRHPSNPRYAWVRRLWAAAPVWAVRWLGPWLMRRFP